MRLQLRPHPFLRVRLGHALHLNVGLDHFGEPLEGCYHGPDAWPWWRRIAVGVCRLQNVAAPTTAWHVWIYTRGRRRTDEERESRREFGRWAQREWVNRGRCIFVALDRRTPEQLGLVAR